MADDPAVPATPVEPVTPTAPASPATPSTVLTAQDPKPAEPAKVEDKPADKPADKPSEPTAAIDAAKLTLPEGFKADEATMKAAIDIIADDKLSPQDRTQKLVDFHAAELKKASEASSKYWVDKNTEWMTEMKSEFGEDVMKNPKIVAVAKMIDSMGEKLSSDFRAAIDFVGAGNSPGIARGLAALAERFNEPKHLTGEPTTAPKDPASQFYPNMKQG